MTAPAEAWPTETTTVAGRVWVPWAITDHRVPTAAAMPETDLGLAERFVLWCGDHWRYRPGAALSVTLTHPSWFVVIRVHSNCRA